LLGWLVGNVHVPWLNGWTDKNAVQYITHGSVSNNAILMGWTDDRRQTVMHTRISCNEQKSLAT